MITPRVLAWIALGGILGSLARFGFSMLLNTDTVGGFPTGTLIINIVGCLAIGMIVPVLAGHPREERLRPFIVTGVLGGFTTFSAFAIEAGVMLDSGDIGLASVYISLTLLLGLIAVPIGVRLTRRLAR
ncbi:MAG: fluoride efflux transporter CrcB [Candidatus Nanopelagicales bacterium]